MRLLAIALLSLLSMIPAGAQDARVPVVVELFTSEGCSSCPSADELLMKIERSQPVGNVQVIALEEHVDYWNNLGWTDRFSAPVFRFRQTTYSQLFNSESIYTPQMVVNGRAAFVGDDEAIASREIGKAAESPAYRLQLQTVPSARDTAVTELMVYVRSAGDRPAKRPFATVWLAVTESRLTSNVTQGENAGRQLRHAPIVRSFGVIGNIEEKPFSGVGLKSTLKLPAEWRRRNLRAVVFVQERDSGRITAAAVTDLP